MPTPARAAVAGNPSDGFGGAVCAVIVPDLAASAKVVSRPFSDESGEPLVLATVERFSRDIVSIPADVSIAVESTIPRSVGLAGSSAIVIEVIRQLCELTNTNLSPLEVADLAHTAERIDLSIAGGWQDQLIQSHRYSAFMDFRNGREIRPLQVTETRSIPLYLAWSTDASAPSGEAHGALQAGSPPGVEVAEAFAGLAEDAAAGLETGDVHRLKIAIDASFDLRREIMSLNPAQEELVHRARRHGACANYAGSGGAVVGVLPKNGEDFVESMRSDGYVVKSFAAG